MRQTRCGYQIKTIFYEEEERLIINKKTESVTGTVEYIVVWHEDPTSWGSDDEEFLEYEKFTNLKELLAALGHDKVEEIRKHYDAKQVKISGISFHAKSEDKETTSSVLVGNKVQGWITVKINNEDIDNRLLMNIKKIKEITDNTLEQYPIKY